MGLAGGENGGGRALAVGVALMLAVATLAACERSSPAPIQIKRPMLNGGAAVAQARPQAGVPGDPARTVTVGAGETIYTIARRHNVSTRILIEANDLAPPYRVTPGQDLVIPGSRLHTVTDGESLYLISRAYNLDMYSLAKANKMVPPYRVYTGQQLAIPGVGVGDGKPAVEVAPVNEVLAGLEPRRGAAPRSGSDRAVTAAPLPGEGVPVKTEEGSGAAKEVAQAAPETEAVPLPAGGGRFLWPVRGRVISGFGPKNGGMHNDGINISAKPGDTVRAAENGVVAYAGNELRGFGNLLLIRHRDGWITAYAHADEILVKRGDQVKRGQVIARVGASGRVAEPQLHFEIRKGTKAVDPLRYLQPAT
ncbi:MAG: LysM peptidoglycan-binding domain-containing M23 family metallopeptidase [Alphaproteobacteria bacterium]|nr:LysM peptidoglycan-binding domain-containing M23 family metallopeptidase [Alphaproteobacteria bacterium]